MVYQYILTKGGILYAKDNQDARLVKVRDIPELEEDNILIALENAGYELTYADGTCTLTLTY